ncbi:sensor histidine kinase [Streptomyces daliensis]|uniref:histidine kinase n=1 Tax=Streptomyces daliensis TaxID=299421 RepID=A0A8T4ISR2_9ACTN|nr:sensor histidine kinase [Streptomyces daliensis]
MLGPARRGYAAAMGRASGLRRRADKVPSWAYDTAVALAITVVSVLLGHDNVPVGWQGLDTRGTLLTCAVNLPMAARRKAPLALALGSYAVWTTYIALDYWPVVNTLGPLLALYTVASLRPLRQTVLCALLLAAIWNYAGTTGAEASPATVLGQSILYTAVICGFGRLAGKAARRSVRLAELAEQLRRERAAGERRAVAEERVRIARELHDVVAHHMSVISVQAGLADYVFRSDPPTARGALATIAETSGEALAELRRLLAVLRVDENGELTGGDEAYVPAPGLDGLGELTARVRKAGVRVRLTVTGQVRELPPGVGQCAYRVVQEALTNVLKHARAATAEVTVGYGARQLEVTVTDDGTGSKPTARTGHHAADVPVSGGGHGLIGMRERARIYGGSLTAGPRPGGGYEVRLTLPA